MKPIALARIAWRGLALTALAAFTQNIDEARKRLKDYPLEIVHTF